MHFNGWSFDMKMVLIRCIMYDVVEDLLSALDINGKINSNVLKYDGKKKN